MLPFEVVSGTGCFPSSSHSPQKRHFTASCRICSLQKGQLLNSPSPGIRAFCASVGGFVWSWRCEVSEPSWNAYPHSQVIAEFRDFLLH